MKQKILEIYKQRLNLMDAKFTLIEHADAIIATVYKIQTKDKTELILKICEQASHYYKELYFLKYFAHKLPIPQVVQNIDPEMNLHGAILMQCLPGELLRTEVLTKDLSFTIGAQLAKIHTYRVDAYGDLTMPSTLVHDPCAYFADKFMESFAECRDHLPTELLQKCLHFFENNLAHIKNVDGPCIIHRDFRPGNIIVQQGALSGIIDWASARSGFAEDDLCPLEIGEWGNNLDIRQSFLDGYASIRPLPLYADVMQLLWLNRAIAVVGFTVKIGSWDNRDHEFYKRNLNIMTQILN